MRQIVYVSTARPGSDISVGHILTASRRNNGRDAITGLLQYNGRRFLQALEGDPARVQTTFDRIRQDPRHFAVVVLSDRAIETREFGEWAMAHSDAAADHDAFVAKVARLVQGAAPAVRGTFEGFAGLRAA